MISIGTNTESSSATDGEERSYTETEGIFVKLLLSNALLLLSNALLLNNMFIIKKLNMIFI